MKKPAIIVLILLAALPLISQEQTPYEYMDLNSEARGSRSQSPHAGPSSSPSVIARISIIAPMFVLEFAPVEHFTFSSSIRIWPTFYVKNDRGQRIYHPSLNPRITLESRYFFSQYHRRLSGRRSDYYSGWYFGLPFVMDLPELSFSMGPVVGFQCTFGRRWYWNVGLGPAVSFQENRFQMTATGTAAFGIILN